jgi:Na+/H+ antiporter NhaD/arsenite permease-like protein
VTIGTELPLWTVLPFAALLFAIAVLPLAAPAFWEKHCGKGLVAALCSAPVVLYLVGAHGAEGAGVLLEKAGAFTSFILLLGSLFVISGGIVVRGSLSGTPLLNTALLGLGALLANAIGTTGASALLVRPLLRANQPRVRKAHIFVFFIFVVSNSGGLLTPLGDPPLFLGFLAGVPFAWTLRLLPVWLLVNALLLVVFNVWDQVVFDREEADRPGSQLEEVMRHEPLRIEGLYNFGFLAAIVAVIVAAGHGIGSGGRPWPFGAQEASLLAIGLLSFTATPAALRRANDFAFGPIVEVAILFAGIFVTMAPALLLLNARAESFGIREPWQFFWASGALSSFLDNAPTYLTFAATAAGLEGIAPHGRYLAEFLARGEHAVRLLIAISAGSVMMGANSYIGNGPNFMVKAIAEQGGVAMPSFGRYMLYSGSVLIPIFVVVTVVFFR